nr:hypothetical protein [Tanacetum cinerariifolium]
VYQVEHKDTKKSNEMYYPRNSEAYKEYYAVATGATPPKTKASFWKKKSSSDTTITPPPTSAAGTRLFTYAKGKQPATTSKAKNEGTSTIPGVPDVPTDESDEEISWNSSDEGDDDDDDEEGNDEDDDAQDDYDDQENADKDNDEEGDDDDDQEEGSDDEQASDEEGEEFIHPSLITHDEEETRDEESFDPISKTPKNTDDKGNGRGVQMADVHMTQEFKDSHVTLTPVNPDGQQQSLSVSSQFVTSMLNPTPDAGIESIFETSSQMDVQPQTTVAPLPFLNQLSLLQPFPL